MKKRNMTPLNFFSACYNLPPDILVSVYSSTNRDLPLWTGKFSDMPERYFDSIIDHMFIYAKDSKIHKLVFEFKTTCKPERSL